MLKSLRNKIFAGFLVFSVIMFVLTAFGGTGFVKAASTVQNPGFETGDLTGWTNASSPSTAASASKTNDVHSGSYSAILRNGTANLYQTLTGLSNGVYSFSTWTRSGSPATCYIEAADFGGSSIQLSCGSSSSWNQITINNINVTNGQLTIRLYVVASSTKWQRFDDITVTGPSGPTPTSGPTATNTPIGPTPTMTNTPSGPTPTPTNTPSGGPSFTRPFNNTIWYRPINKSAATYATFNNNVLTGAMVVGTGSAPWSVAFYQASSSDPSGTVIFPINAVDAWTLFSRGCLRGGKTINAGSRCESDIRAMSSTVNSSPDYNQYSMPPINLNYQRHDYIPAGYSGYVIKAPITAYASTDTDAHIAILQPDGRWMVEMYEAYHFSNGDWFAQDINFTDIQGDGSGLAGGVKASMIPNSAGLIRSGELPTGPITHALACTISQAVLGPLDGNTAVWPANSWDTNSGYTGAVPMGSLLAIPANLNVNDYPALTPSGRVMFQALQDYGVYIIDRGGSGLSFQAEVNGAGLDWTGEANDLYNIIVPLLQRVSNNPGPGGW